MKARRRRAATGRKAQGMQEKIGKEEANDDQKDVGAGGRERKKMLNRK